MKPINFLLISIGLILAVLFQFQRAPRIYNGLWGDEVCNNHIYLATESSLVELSRSVNYFYKPVIDFALKKWVWFNLFSPTEAGFSLVPWFYAGIALLLLLFLPWTNYPELRLVAILLMGISPFEFTYSVEAQCYSFSSLLSWCALFGFGWSFHQLDRNRTRNAFLGFLGSLAAGLNSHFFAWPYIVGAALFFTAKFYRSIPNSLVRFWSLRFFAGISMVVGTTVIFNLFPIYSLLFNTPRAESAAFLWGRAWADFMAHWRWLGFPAWFYGIVAAAGLILSVGSKRWLAWVCGFATGPALFLTYLAASRSDFPTQDRYLIAYVAPTIFLFLIGCDSVVSRLSRFSPRMGRLCSLGGVVLMLVYFLPNYRSLIPDARDGFKKMQATSLNYSDSYEFFEKAKSYRRPILAINNMCWLNPIPDLYLNFLGSKLPGGPATVLNVAECETTPWELSRGLSSFLEKNFDRGLILATFYKKVDTPSPCDSSIPILERTFKVDEGCFAVFEAKHIAPWLKKNFIPQKLEYEKSNDTMSWQTRFLKKVLGRFLFYLGPLFLAAFFIFIMRRPLPQSKGLSVVDMREVVV